MVFYYNLICLKNIFSVCGIAYSMKKIHFGVIKFRRSVVNSIIVLILAILSALTIWGGNMIINTSTVSGVYYNGDKSSKNVSLMINVYWGNEYLDQMLEILRENDVKTTFFIGGTWAVLNEDFLQKIYQDGHEIANHGYHHKDHNKLDEQGNLDEISTTHTIIKQLLNIEMDLFAPPSGAYDKTTVSVASSLGYKTIMWTRDTVDWRDKDSDLIYSRAIKNACGGDLILMHPTEKTVEALPKIINWFKQNGFNLTTVSQTIEPIV